MRKNRSEQKIKLARLPEEQRAVIKNLLTGNEYISYRAAVVILREQHNIICAPADVCKFWQRYCKPLPDPTDARNLLFDCHICKVSKGWRVRVWSKQPSVHLSFSGNGLIPKEAR